MQKQKNKTYDDHDYYYYHYLYYIVVNAIYKICCLRYIYKEIYIHIYIYIYIWNRGIQYFGESITPVNLRMNIHRKGKSVANTLSITIKCLQSYPCLHWDSGKARRNWFHKWLGRLSCAKTLLAKRRLLDEKTAHHISLTSQWNSQKP